MLDALLLVLLACGRAPTPPPFVATQPHEGVPRVVRAERTDAPLVPLADDGIPRGVLAVCTDGRILAQEREGDGMRLVVIQDGALERTPLRGLRLRDATCTPSGAILLEASVESAGDLYLVDGQRLTRLTDAPGGSFEPSLHPTNGLVFASSRDGNAELYRRALDGGEVTRLTHHPLDDLRPRWSPDGEHILFVTEREGGRRAWTMDASGKGARPVLLVARGEHLFADWTPDGRVVVVVHDQDGRDILLINPKARAVLRRIGGPDPDEDPQVSPDGRWLVRTQAGDARVDLVFLDLIDGTELVVPGIWSARWPR